MARLYGGASGPDYVPPGPDPDEWREYAEAGRAILEQRQPDPARQRSRWERVFVEGTWVEVEVERMAPAEQAE